LALEVAHRFFVNGTIHRVNYGGAPLIVFNDRQKTSIEFPNWLEADVKTIERVLGVGFFLYGPRLWMVGEIEPLKALQEPEKKDMIVARILREYPSKTLSPADYFYRIRIEPKDPSDPSEYDSPPDNLVGNGRLDAHGLPMLYASQDIQICVHECRVTVDDTVYVATLASTRELKLLDLTHLLKEEETEFESLDLAVHMLFLAGKHSYKLASSIAESAQQAGFDGVVYPSYFSLVRTGSRPFETIYGMSIRRIPQLSMHAQSQILPNLALFGRPIASLGVEVKGINKLILNRVEYDLLFGPVGYKHIY